MMMTGQKTNTAIAFLTLCCFLILTSCGPGGPAPGTPAFYWQAAKDTFAAHDYLKTVDHLEKIIRTDNEFTQRALPLNLVVTAGLANAYMDLAGLFDSGIKATRGTNPALFKARMNYQTLAERRVLDFLQAYLKFEKSAPEPNITLAFGYPGASMAEPAGLTRIKKDGAIPGEVMMVALERRMIEQGIANSVCEAVGAPGDPAKTQSLLNSGNAQVPREVFVLSLADHLYDQALLFDRSKMDKSDRLKILCDKGLAAIKTVKENEASKALTDKIQLALKAGKL
jgi:hypothetical protein